MALHACGGEFQCSLRCENQNGPIELALGTGSLGQRIVVFDVQDGLNRDCWPISYHPPRAKRINLHFRPLLPSNAGPLVGCLLLHIIARSYGANQTHLLCLTPLFVILADTSSAFRPSQFSFGSEEFPNDLRRTYLNIHSPIIVCAIASTTLVC